VSAYPVVPARVGEINIFKLSTLPKELYRFNKIPIKIPRACFSKIEKYNPKYNPKILIEPQKIPK